MRFLLASKGDVQTENLPFYVTIEVLIPYQENNPLCINIRCKLKGWKKIPFEENPDTGILQRTLSNEMRIEIPKSFQARIILLSYYPKTTSHPGVRKMSRTMAKFCYWPSMTIPCLAIVRFCEEGDCERVT